MWKNCLRRKGLRHRPLDAESLYIYPLALARVLNWTPRARRQLHCEEVAAGLYPAIRTVSPTVSRAQPPPYH